MIVSRYHATVRKREGRWMYRVFKGWHTGRPELLVQGTTARWTEAYAQAAGTVSSFRSMYERPRR